MARQRDHLVMTTDAIHFLLTAASIWTGELQVLGVYSSEAAALGAANWDRLAATDASPVRFSIEQWHGSRRLSVLTSSPPFNPEDGAEAGWSV